MRKKTAVLLAISIVIGSSLSTFANTVDQIDEVQTINEVEEELITQESEIIEEEQVEDQKDEGDISEIPPVIHKQKQVILQLNHKVALVDGEEHLLEMVPKVIEGRTYLPLRFMANQLLEAQVNWDSKAKKVTIIKDGEKVEITIGSEKAYINGDQVLLENTAMIEKGTTYLPLRTTADLFDIQTDFDPATKRITLEKIDIQKPSKPIAKKPIALFHFEKGEYTAGQAVWAVDNSFHQDESIRITDREWMVDFNEKQKNNRLEVMFSKPNAGTYSVSLRVKDEKGNWSQWVTRKITIKPNQKPVITTFETEKDSYAGGEPITFNYTFDNESWEGIKAERWTYRQSWEADNKKVIDKPSAIFDQGQYVVSLQLQDDYNNWSDAKEVTVNVTAESKRSELEYRFTEGKPGDIIDNFANFNYHTYKQLTPRERNLGTGTLFMSNSPEKVQANGILYRDTIEGDGRILLHHYNGFTPEENTRENKKVVLVAENTTKQDVNFTISNKVAKGPSTDILFVGQQLLYDYLKGAPGQDYSLKPGEKVTIYDSSDKRWEAGQLVSAQMDVKTTGQVNFTVAAMGKGKNSHDLETLSNLQRDAHPRGTFYQKDLDYKIHLDEQEPTKLVLGENDHEWVMGYDTMTGSIVQNKGNFAVNYRIEITADEDMGIMLNPRAGVFRGAVQWDDQEPFLAPSRGYFMGHNSKGVMLGVIKAGETRTLKYSLPNGSASPVLLLCIPKDHW